jgi:hypothetical protein
LNPEVIAKARKDESTKKAEDFAAVGTPAVLGFVGDL